jgi:hypothetical protein
MTPLLPLSEYEALIARATGTGWEAAYRQDVAALVAEVRRLTPKKLATWDGRQLYGPSSWERALLPELGAYRFKGGVWMYVTPETRSLADGWTFAPDEPTCRAQIEEYARSKGYEVRE